jgi:hypothetical protein
MRVKTAISGAVLVVALGACGGGSSSSSTTAKSGTTSGKSSGSGGGDFCTAAHNAPNALRQSSASLRTPGGAKQYFTQAKSFLDQVVSSAPAVIKSDVQTVAAAFDQLVSQLAAVNYDLTKLGASQIQTLSSPQLTAASNRIQQYLSGVCGITTSTSFRTSSTS